MKSLMVLAGQAVETRAEAEQRILAGRGPRLDPACFAFDAVSNAFVALSKKHRLKHGMVFDSFGMGFGDL